MFHNYSMKRLAEHMRLYARWYLLGFFWCLATILLYVSVVSVRRGLSISFLDVGQGDGILIQSPTGVQVLVDGGPGNNLIAPLQKEMAWYDKTVDMLIVTNPDKDHFEGFIGLLDHYKTFAVLEPGTTGGASFPLLGEALAKKQIPRFTALSNQRVNLGGEAYLYILFPDRDISGLSSNDGSIVMKLVYGKTCALLQGDSTAKIEEYLLEKAKAEQKEKLHCDIIKLGHHGSRTSSTLEYLKASGAKWGIISAGEGNSYGHPHQEVLENLAKAKIEALGTYNLGTISFFSDGERWERK